MQIEAVGKQFWAGRFALAQGTGLFIGNAGDNCPHTHYAHQLSVALDKTVEIKTDMGVMSSTSLFIPAGCYHQLNPGRVISLYVDATSTMAKQLLTSFSNPENVSQLPSKLEFTIRGLVTVEADLQQTLSHFADQFQRNFRADKRLEVVLTMLQNEFIEQQLLSLTQLAHAAELSQSRFSHWFTEHTGLPLRSYRKWLRLLAGVRLIAAGKPLSEATQESLFSDQAHFSRTFKQMFGLTPKQLVNMAASNT
jgi:AraC-like DNA-binding protein